LGARTGQLERQVAERTDALQQEIGQRLVAEEALREVEMDRAVTEERGRLARDLHDSVTQSLYSLTLFIEASRELAEKGQLDLVKHGLERSSGTALQALKELRLLVYELRPLALREMGLCGAIQDRLDAVENRAGVQTELVMKMDPACDLPGDVEEALFRITQEALNNALKHSRANAIVVRLESASAGHLELEISDDGCGFDPKIAAGRGGLGLQGMEERVTKLGGQFTVVSSPGAGTRILVELEDT
jgi:signal transduction histidine kinase